MIIKRTKSSQNSLLVLNSKLFGDFQFGYHFLKLGERNESVAVLVCLDDGPVHQLLELSVAQIVPHHYLEHLEQVSIGYVPVFVHVVDLEGELQLLLLVCPGGEGGQTVDEFNEGNLSVLVFVENLNDSEHQRVLGDGGDVEEFFRLEFPALVFVEFVEVLVESLDFGLGEDVWIVYSLDISHYI